MEFIFWWEKKGLQSEGEGWQGELPTGWAKLVGLPLALASSFLQPSGSQSLPDALIPFHFLQGGLHDAPALLPSSPTSESPPQCSTPTCHSHLLQGGLPDALASPTPTPLTPLGPVSMSFPVASLNSLLPSFLHANISSTRLLLIQHTVCQAQGVWTTPLPTIHIQVLLWP